MTQPIYKEPRPNW
ncbi:hypothetical protein NXF25_010065 [Crotalus adamanteus]|uniref:Uncharacterized protein n=1 Tax=Crotalus adamanteus TaxID=8729 RepID=A0AAW1BI37_CROAD